LRHALGAPLLFPAVVIVGPQPGLSIFVHPLEMHLVNRSNVRSFDDLGLKALTAGGATVDEILPELTLNACETVGVETAHVPLAFPLAVADRLRGSGIRLDVDARSFARRRRVKNSEELDGIRRASRGACRAMEAVRNRLGNAGVVTCEELRDVVIRTLVELDLALPSGTIAHGVQTASALDRGSGVVLEGEAVIIDLNPMDTRSGLHADMSRTLCVGRAPVELRRYHAICLRARDAMAERIRAGVATDALVAAACDIFEAEGFSTFRTADPDDIDEGEPLLLGHGVGLERLEPPFLYRSSDTLLENEVIAIEPGLYRRNHFGCRVEDLVVVTKDGHEVLTEFSRELAVGRPE
jgi:Xaa-Pro aminopeptidase